MTKTEFYDSLRIGCCTNALLDIALQYVYAIFPSADVKVSFVSCRLCKLRVFVGNYSADAMFDLPKVSLKQLMLDLGSCFREQGWKTTGEFSRLVSRMSNL